MRQSREGVLKEKGESTMTQASEDTRRKHERIQKQESALLGCSSKFAEPQITVLMQFGGAGAGADGKGKKGRY